MFRCKITVEDNADPVIEEEAEFEVATGAGGEDNADVTVGEGAELGIKEGVNVSIETVWM